MLGLYSIQKMIIKVSDNIISPLGEGTEVNLEAVLNGETALSMHHGFGEDYMASMFTNRLSFTDLAVSVARGAMVKMNYVLTPADTLLVLSTTKGEDLHLWRPALAINEALGLSRPPVVVSNACTSGVCAQIVAMRMLCSGICNTAIVVGAEVLTSFIVSGFQSLKALSDERCRPFDIDRRGLNLGEAAACMVLTQSDEREGWQLIDGSMHNDANHISGPSRTGEGSYLCLRDMMKNTIKEHVALLSLHGTATIYNDEMESIAVHRAGLDSVPAIGLKGQFGHTLGAAGVLETLLGLKAIERGVIPATAGYKTQGTTYPLNLSAGCEMVNPGANVFIKLLSGFGGCNAAVKYRKG